jgi:plastocyanin
MGSAYLMGKQALDRRKNALAILVIFLLIISMTSMAANAKSSGDGKIVDVAIKNFAFSPMSIKISEGDTVKWTNIDSVDHTVDGSIFKSGAISKGQSYEFLFTEPGIYNYKCSPHPYMTGTVTVVAKK